MELQGWDKIISGVDFTELDMDWIHQWIDLD